MKGRDGVPHSALAADPDRIELPRARSYLLLATLLARPPDASLLERLGALTDDGTEWGEALAALAREATSATAREAEREFNRLFVGVVRGELLPYASYYLTGFLQDRPLVALRRDMAVLGIARRSGVAEPEDHVAAICEMMAGLATGELGPGPASGSESLERQRAFFAAHLMPWAPRFFRDLETAEAARLYRPVGALGSLLMEIERQAFGFD